MKKILTKTLCVLAVLGYASIGLAGCCDPCCPPPPKPQCEPCRTCEICPPCGPCCQPCCTEVVTIGEPCNCAYNAPARIDPACGWKAWISGTFLYYQAKEKGLEFAYDYTLNLQGTIAFPIITGTATADIDVVNIDFDYHPAFKVGLGMSECRDDWTFYLEYTRFNASNSSSLYDDPTFVYDTAASNYLINGNTSPWLYFPSFNSVLDTVFNYAHAKWTLDYNMFDLEVGRPYYLGKKLVFKPRVALRGGWIDQKYGFDTEGYSFDTSGVTTLLYTYEGRNKQDSWMIGPRVALGTDWLVSCDFRIFVNVAGSLTYQKFTTEKWDSMDAVLPEGVTVGSPYVGNANAADEISYITPNVDFSIGLGYGSYFCNNEWYLDISVGYDFNYFWNQNQMRHLNDSINAFVDGSAGNLMLHGLNVSARVDF